MNKNYCAINLNSRFDYSLQKLQSIWVDFFIEFSRIERRKLDNRAGSWDSQSDPCKDFFPGERIHISHHFTRCDGVLSILVAICHCVHYINRDDSSTQAYVGPHGVVIWIPLLNWFRPEEHLPDNRSFSLPSRSHAIAISPATHSPLLLYRDASYLLQYRKTLLHPSVK